jgi:predicted  nucleic acid-binding Zn-ribbon protein
MGKTEVSREVLRKCPRCGAKLYEEIREDKKTLYLVCEKDGCGYEKTVKYKCMKFSFTYRDEFTTEVVAKNMEEAKKKIENIDWKRTGYDLWEDYLDVEYSPVVKLT